VLEDGPAPPFRVLWTFPAPEGRSLSGAVIVDGLAVTVGQRAIYAVEVSTGDLSWEVPRAGGPISVPAIASGQPRIILYLEGPDVVETGGTPTSSPTTASPTGDGGEEGTAGSSLVAIDLADQAELWRVPLGAIARTGVTVDGDTAYVGDEAGTLYAVPVADGAVRWTSEAPGRLDVPIAVADERVIVISRSADDRGVIVAAHEVATGERRWEVSAEVGSTASSAAAAADGIVVVALADRLVRALGGEDGDELWASLALSFFSPVTSPALRDGSVFVADLGGGLYRFDSEDGVRAWSYQFNEVVLRSSPVVSGAWVLLGLNDGRLVAVSGESGRLAWQSAASAGLIGTIALSPEAIVAVKGGAEGGLIAFEHDPDGRLVDIASPTELDGGTTLARIGAAAAIALALLLVPGMLLRRRFGDAFAAEGEDDGFDPDEEEKED
jgi:outer membrane protein assembly factor BamB